MTVYLTARLADGRVLYGPIMGNGGFLGNGALHAGQEHAERSALRLLAHCQELAANNCPLPIYEPENGHVAMFPNYSAESDGEPVLVPLVGSRFV